MIYKKFFANFFSDPLFWSFSCEHVPTCGVLEKSRDLVNIRISSLEQCLLFRCVFKNQNAGGLMEEPLHVALRRCCIAVFPSSIIDNVIDLIHDYISVGLLGSVPSLYAPEARVLPVYYSPPSLKLRRAGPLKTGFDSQ